MGTPKANGEKANTNADREVKGGDTDAEIAAVRLKYDDDIRAEKAKHVRLQLVADPRWANGLSGERCAELIAAARNERIDFLESARDSEVARLIAEKDRNKRIAELESLERYDEIAEIRRTWLYGYDPGPIIPEELRLPSPLKIRMEGLKNDPEAVSVAGDMDGAVVEWVDGSVAVTLPISKLGPVTLIIHDAKTARRNLFRQIVSDFPDDLDRDFQLAKEAETVQRAAIVQNLRDLTSAAWAGAIRHIRSRFSGEKQLRNLQDKTNAKFRDGKGRPRRPEAESSAVILEYRQLMWERRRDGDKSGKYSWLPILRSRLAERGINYSIDALDDFAWPDVKNRD